MHTLLVTDHDDEIRKIHLLYFIKSKTIKIKEISLKSSSKQSELRTEKE